MLLRAVAALLSSLAKVSGGPGVDGPTSRHHQDLALRERELNLRERDLNFRERELALRERAPSPAAMPTSAGDIGVFDVHHFGATPDDGTDDTPSIQSALDAASAHGGVVRIPRGVYDITGLHLQSDRGGESAGGLTSVRVVGDGRSTVLKMLPLAANGTENRAVRIMLDYQGSHGGVEHLAFVRTFRCHNRAPPVLLPLLLLPEL